MGAFESDLNTTLVSIFNSIGKIEERSLKLMGRGDLSLGEVHVIEAVGKNGPGGSTISEIASDLEITLSTVTVFVNKLAKKGYVKKTRGESDGRMVYVNLTRLGEKIENAHRYFHRQMVRSASAGFTEEERSSLLEGTKKLNFFFKETLKKMEE